MTQKQLAIILEDDVMGAMCLESFFESAGYEVRLENNVDTALAEGLARNPSVIVSDWRVDGSISPAELVRRLRERNSDLRVVFITGYPEENVRPHLSGLEPYELYIKPIDFEKVVGPVSRHEDSACETSI